MRYIFVLVFAYLTLSITGSVSLDAFFDLLRFQLFRVDLAYEEFYSKLAQLSALDNIFFFAMNQHKGNFIPCSLSCATCRFAKHSPERISKARKKLS
jgi:hypothetical protein